MGYEDFLSVVMPCDNQVLRADIAQRPNFEVPRTTKLGQNVEDALTILLEKEIAFARVMEDLKQKMESEK